MVADTFAKPRILVVEDEGDVLEMLTFNLLKEGYEVLSAASGRDALERLWGDVRPHLVLLDLMLPDLDGLEVCRRAKANPNLRSVPIIMVTAKGAESDVVVGLELGADDYVTKPFSVRVLLSRVRAVLRFRMSGLPGPDEVIECNGIRIDPRRRQAQFRGTPLTLTFSEFNVLHLLACRPGWVYTRQQIVDAARGVNHDPTERAVDVHIMNLRRKLAPAGAVIETVRGVGYRFAE